MEERLYTLIKELTVLQLEVGESEMHYNRLSTAYNAAMDELKRYAPIAVYDSVAGLLDD